MPSAVKNDKWHTKYRLFTIFEQLADYVTSKSSSIGLKSGIHYFFEEPYISGGCPE